VISETEGDAIGGHGGVEGEGEAKKLKANAETDAGPAFQKPADSQGDKKDGEKNDHRYAGSFGVFERVKHASIE
jgi:hypothetical protein